MFSLSDVLVLVWFLPVVLQIFIPLVILIVRLSWLGYQRIFRPQKERVGGLPFPSDSALDSVQ